MGIPDRNKISFAIEWHLITACSAFPIKDKRYSWDCGSDFHDFRQFQPCAQVDPHKRSESTMMLHEGVRDRADDTDRIRPEVPIEFFLEKNHARRSILVRLVVHTVIRNQSNNCVEFGKPTYLRIDHPVEGIRFGVAWTMAC